MADILYLPDRGRLLVCTDLQGNLRDFERMEALFRAAMVESEGQAHLLFTGDLIHGPHMEPHEWPDYLGAYYRDQSPEIVDGFLALQGRFPGHIHAILGNHEHGHIGGPHTAKFAEDEVLLLERIVGRKGARKLRAVFETLPLVAVAPCGIVFTHGAPAADIVSADQIKTASLTDFDGGSPLDILESPVVGKILWARSARPEVARRFLEALGGHVSVYGHDVVPEGYECIGDEQMIVSTSFGVEDENKIYLDLDLAGTYRSVHDLREGVEILPLYPDAAAAAGRVDTAGAAALRSR